jgi:aspartate carbamoyltransferase catalytic subunit
MLKGEGIQETLTTLRDLRLDGMVIRSPYVGICNWAMRTLGIGVINAGEGMGEHPTQALLDLYTLYKEWQGEFRGKKLVIVGDILRSRVARSLIVASVTLGMEVTLVGPLTLLPKPPPRDVRLSYELDPLLSETDALYLLRIQKERLSTGGPYLPDLKDYFFAYGLSPQRLSRMKGDAVYLHPGPVNLGVELHPALFADQPRNLIHKQVKNGVPIRMAVFYKLFGGGEGI